MKFRKLYKKAATDTTANMSLNEIIGNKADAAATGLTATNSVMSYLKRLAGAEITIAKTDGNVLNGSDDLFVITGGPILVMEFVGIVTTAIGGTANMTIQEGVTTPAGTVSLSTTVAISTNAAGTSYTFTAVATPVLTPTTAGALALVPVTRWLCPIGTIRALGSAAQTGVIAWYMSYKPLSPLSKVVVAA
jgi:hypothetical protein